MRIVNKFMQIFDGCAMRVSYLPSVSELRAYLACAYFGSGIIGADMAARKLFQKDANDLWLEEAALISAMLTYPRPLEPPVTWELKVERRKRYAIHVYSSSKAVYSGPYEDSLRCKISSSG